MPSSPNLLFTNAGMNQFVPYFLGTQKAPYSPPRAADTQKCIRAGGKHNDLEDVGYDTYHHTFFEMLGNWSFGDYFKKEAIDWAWELIVERWKFPANRLYASVYQPGDGEPGEFDQEAYDHWEGLFTAAGIDPKIHIVFSGKKDNFWMMGDTGPCGPCSELHIDLTPNGDSQGKLVNQDSPLCIEIWNLVFIQYNAEPDGSFRPLPERHVDTGMGFERVCGILQGTKGFTDFTTLASNYNTDVFAPSFAALEEISGKTYRRTMPSSRQITDPQEKIDVAFRVIADHLRTLSFSIADGILPGNKDRNYVLRRILRRAVRYGRTLGLGEDGKPFLSRLVPTLVKQFGPAFPELVTFQERITETLDTEERSFNRTLDRGLTLFNAAVSKLGEGETEFPALTACELYDTYGFPLDLTALMAIENGLSLNDKEVDARMEEIRKISQGSRKSKQISVQEISTDITTVFTGFDESECDAHLLEVHSIGGEWIAIPDRTPFYAEKGGQVSDTGVLLAGGDEIEVQHTLPIGNAIGLVLSELPSAFEEGKPLPVRLRVDASRRRAIESHHTATHLMHHALHEVVSKDIAQQGSYVGPDRLRFDFNSKPLTPEQVADVEREVNLRIQENCPVSWQEVLHSQIQDRSDIMQFFGDKYGDLVRVVQIGGETGRLNGFSMELCGGTHVRQTGQLGLFKIRSEGAIASGIRRIEALTGAVAVDYINEQLTEKDQLNRELEAKLLEANKALTKERSAVRAREADRLLAGEIRNAMEAGTSVPSVVMALEGDGELLQECLNSLKKHAFPGIGIFTVTEAPDKVHLGIGVAKGLVKEYQAGKLLQELAPIVDGRGGGSPEMARGAGKKANQVSALIEKARERIG